MASFLELEFPVVEMTAAQIEFPLRVAVCAWCKPREHGSGLGVISHGICPRHLNKLKLEATGRLPNRSKRSSRRTETGLGALLFPC